MKGTVLLSGGIDSAVTLKKAKDQIKDVNAIHFSYGQQTEEIEKRNSMKLAEQYDVHLEVVSLEDIFNNFKSGTMLDKNYDSNKTTDKHGQSVGYVHMRNLYFLTTAAAIMDQKTRDEEINLYIGAQKNDKEHYPDCRPKFLKNAQKAINQSTQKNQFKIKAPLIDKTKKQILKTAKNLEIPLKNTISCYNPIDNKPCGECPACKKRKQAIKEITK
ncbi:MAG: 7-cyano-7-deazaguanine synthase [Candidatus Methanohalarchaeum thermophilum]|uniref:7-cyano-7-deazaguanine synthase n=1 Tax=Methanohalarchaeum thermophilum TaxID=1903181 RepID=A0A1Q6DWH4_METT1|nr:MAG: 7-cyano-7-deazaguanine synthase [Candidatus Methanohalarchaeum thermophilum]